MRTGEMLPICVLQVLGLCLRIFVLLSELFFLQCSYCHFFCKKSLVGSFHFKSAMPYIAKRDNIDCFQESFPGSINYQGQSAVEK